MKIVCALLLSLLVLPGPALAADRPSRIIALSWETAEYLLALGITPLAIADRDDYRQWVVQPALPATVRDVGSRLEPNLELIHQLQPDLILTNSSLDAAVPLLQAIAPTLRLQPFSASHDNVAQAEKLQEQLARRLGRLAQHRQFMQQEARRYAALRQRLLKHFGPHLPAVCVVRMATATSYWAYGDNSTPQAVMQRLGLKNACPQPGSVWGAHLRQLPQLASVGAQPVLHIPPFDQYAQLQRSPLWQSFAFVQQQRFIGLPPVWTHGGLASMGRLADAMVHALLRTPWPTPA